MVGQGKAAASSKNSKRKPDESENVVSPPSRKKRKVVAKVNASGTKRKPSEKMVASKVKRTPPGKVASKVTKNSEPQQSEKASASSKKKKAKKKKGPSTSINSSPHESAKRLEQIKGKVEKNLLCTICQDIFHDCICVQPCLHSFCSGCYSPWMKKSDKCPTCRLKVTRISKNHMINNLVETFISQFPDKKRTDADLKELDARNTITQDMLYPKIPSRTSSSDYETSSDSESEDSFINVFDLPHFDPNNSELSGLSSDTPTSVDLSSEISSSDENSTASTEDWSSADDSSSSYD